MSDRSEAPEAVAMVAKRHIKTNQTSAHLSVDTHTVWIYMSTVYCADCQMVVFALLQSSSICLTDSLLSSSERAPSVRAVGENKNGILLCWASVL